MRILRLLSLCFLVLFNSCKSDTKKDTVEKTEVKKSEEVEVSKNKKTPSKKKAEPKKSKQNQAPVSNNLTETVKISNINYSLIESRLLVKINRERARLGLTKFKVNRNLYKAAVIHNDYMVRADILDHNESGTSTPNMKDRIQKAGGKFRTAGENIQYEGFTIRTTNGVESIIAPTYEALAEQLWQNWRTSPPHYKNITNPDFMYLGTALRWSDKKTAVFATQVYGG